MSVPSGVADSGKQSGAGLARSVIGDWSAVSFWRTTLLLELFSFDTSDVTAEVILRYRLGHYATSSKLLLTHDVFGIDGIIFVALDEGTDELRGNQPSLAPHCHQLARDVMRPSTGFGGY